MSESSNNRTSLSQLYRRFAGGTTGVSVPDADDLLQLARVAHAEDAASPLYADLLRFSRELEAPSAQLSADVTMAFEQNAPVLHRRGTAHRRVAAADTRRWRGVAALAASLMAVIGVWTLHGPAPQPAASLAATSRLPDRIFAALDDRNVASNAPRDEIFRDQFSSAVISSDVIFRSHDG